MRSSMVLKRKYMMKKNFNKRTRKSIRMSIPKKVQFNIKNSLPIIIKKNYISKMVQEVVLAVARKQAQAMRSTSNSLLFPMKLNKMQSRKSY